MYWKKVPKDIQEETVKLTNSEEKELDNGKDNKK